MNTLKVSNIKYVKGYAFSPTEPHVIKSPFKVPEDKEKYHEETQNNQE